MSSIGISYSPCTISTSRAHFETSVGGLWDAGLVVDEADHGGAVLLDERSTRSRRSRSHVTELTSALPS